MPCYDLMKERNDVPDEEAILNAKMPAVLCALVKSVGECFILNSVNWENAGVTEKEFGRWLSMHRSGDFAVEKLEKGYLGSFSFRAEVNQDVENFSKACIEAGIENMYRTYPMVLGDRGDYFVPPDCLVDFATKEEVPLERIREIMRRVPDSHAMKESMRPVCLHLNNCERDPNVK